MRSLPKTFFLSTLAVVSVGLTAALLAQPSWAMIFRVWKAKDPPAAVKALLAAQSRLSPMDALQTPGAIGDSAALLKLKGQAALFPGVGFVPNGKNSDGVVNDKGVFTAFVPIGEDKNTSKNNFFPQVDKIKRDGLQILKARDGTIIKSPDGELKREVVLPGPGPVKKQKANEVRAEIVQLSLHAEEVGGIEPTPFAEAATTPANLKALAERIRRIKASGGTATATKPLLGSFRGEPAALLKKVRIRRGEPTDVGIRVIGGGAR